MHIRKPFFQYNGGGAAFIPDQTAEDEKEPHAVERIDQIAGSGKKASLYIGPRTFEEVTFRWLDELNDGKKTEALTFWDAVKDGSEFEYVFDDSTQFAGTGVAGDGSIAGIDSDGDAIICRAMTVENTEIMLTPESVEGYWMFTLRMREVV